MKKPKEILDKLLQFVGQEKKKRLQLGEGREEAEVKRILKEIAKLKEGSRGSENQLINLKAQLEDVQGRIGAMVARLK